MKMANKHFASNFFPDKSTHWKKKKLPQQDKVLKTREIMFMYTAKAIRMLVKKKD